MRKDEEGFALLSAVSVLAILAMLIAGLGLAMRRESDAARNLRDGAIARARIEAAIEIVIEGLLVRNPAERWPVDGKSRVLRFDGAAIQVTAEDEAGKIDLNWSPVELIRGLLAETGADSNAQLSIPAEITRRRQGIRMPGKPPGETTGATLLGGPRLRDIGPAPFESDDALLTLPGMTRAVYRRMRPYVTVYSQSVHVSVPAASRPVLLAIPGITPHDADLIIAARAKATGELVHSVPDDAKRFVDALDTRVVTITAAADTASGGHVVRRAVVSLTAKPYQPVQILEWREDADDEADLSAIPEFAAR